MENGDIELDEDFETPRDFHTPISRSSSESERQYCDSDECTVHNGSEVVQSRIDIESISIALDNSPSTTVSTCSDDHQTNRNILSMQKEEAFQDWLDAKKFVYTHAHKNHKKFKVDKEKRRFLFFFFCLEYRTN